MSALGSYRNANRPASPTNTAYSGVSNYRNDSYKPLRPNANTDSKVPATPALDGRVIAKIHFEELNLFLESHMAKGAHYTSRRRHSHP
jgi:hypothetical protein